MFGSQTAESSVCSENLPPWKLLKLPDIPALWGVCPPAALLVFPQSPAQGTQSPLRGGRCPHNQVISKMLKVLLPDSRSSLSRCWFFICALLQLLWVQLSTTPPTSTSPLASLPGQTHIILALAPTLTLAPQLSCKLSLVTLGSTAGIHTTPLQEN